MFKLRNSALTAPTTSRLVFQPCQLALLLSSCCATVHASEPTAVATASVAPRSAETTERLQIRGQKQSDLTEVTPQTAELLAVAGVMNDPLTAVFSLPGVVYADGDYGGQPAVRGSSPDDNAFLIDGLPAGYLFHIFGNSILNENLLQDFQLHPAAFGAQYGNAIGGVFAAKLRDPRAQALGGVADVSFLQSGLLLEGEITENQRFYTSWRQSNLHYFLGEGDELDDDVTLYQAPTSSDYQARYLWQPDQQHKLTLTAAGASDSAKLGIAKNSEQGRTDPDSIGDARLKTDFNSQLLQYLWQPDADYQLQLSLQQLNNQEDTGFGDQQFLQFKDKTRTLQLQNLWQFAADHRLELGLEQQQRDITYRFDLIPYFCTDHQPDCFAQRGERLQQQSKLSYRTDSAFITEHWQLTDDWLWQLGLRLEQQNYQQQKEKHALPRTSLSWQATAQLKLELKAGQYTQFGELDKKIPQLGNPQLQQPKANHVAFGVHYQLATDWSLHADSYLKKMTRLPLALTALDADQAKHYSNDSAGRAYGVELLLRKARSDGWHGWASLSWSQADRTDLRRQVTTAYYLDTPLVANLVLNYQLNERWTLGGRLTLRSGAKYTPIIGSKPHPYQNGYRVAVYGAHNSATLPIYHRLDIQADYQSSLFGLPVTYSYAILNLLNRKNISGYYLMAGKDELAESYQLQAEENIGIFPSIGLKVQF